MTDTSDPQPPSALPLEQAIQATFQQAVAHQQANQLQEAENLYRAILQIQQNHPGANHNLGVLLVQAQQPAAGLAHLEAALRDAPGVEQYWLSCIDALILVEQIDDARQVAALGRQHGLQGAAVDALEERILASGRQIGEQSDAVRQHDVKEVQAMPATEQAGKKQHKSKHNKLDKPLNKAKISHGKEPGAKEMAALVALFDQGDYKNGEKFSRELTVHCPRYGYGWKFLGAALQLQGRDEEALIPLQKAVELLPGDAEAHSNLGATLLNMGQLDNAATSIRRALEIKPDFAEAHINLGNVQRDNGQLDEAAASYGRALKIRPDYAVALNGLGSILQSLGRLDEAVANYRRALEISPGFGMALNNLALALKAQGQAMMAFNAICRSLKVNETPEARNIFVDCVMPLNLKMVGGDIRNFLVRALSEPWWRPSDLARACTYLIKHDPCIRKWLTRAAESRPCWMPTQDFFADADFVQALSDPLLCALLDSVPVSDIELERLMTMMRHAMLEAATGSTVANDGRAILNFCGALAHQCFINEYVFACTEDESSRAHALCDSLAAALEIEAPIPPLWPIAVAAYFPLHSLPFADLLLASAWPEEVTAVLVQQIGEPGEERQYRATVPRLTGIDDGVSLLVQSQYEENPYPRWVKSAPIGQPLTVDRYVRRTFPLVDFQPLGDGGDTEILVAGCGTGQQPIQIARQFPGAHIMAVDLSLTSLCYAMRKTRESGLSSIEYAQADILKLGAIGRSFDVIASSGVLHHLADPLAGWRVLLSLLRPGGFMFLGFYSEVARRDIVRAQNFIAEKGYGSSAEDIRSCRQDIINHAESAGFGAAIKSGDFFSTSACRDLLFHVQEHRMTLAGINAFLGENNLRFLGFEHTPSVLHAYKQRFPDDQAATNLNNWEVFENENPDTFLGMYQFWVQKTDPTRVRNLPPPL